MRERQREKVVERALPIFLFCLDEETQTNETSCPERESWQIKSLCKKKREREKKRQADCTGQQINGGPRQLLSPVDDVSLAACLLADSPLYADLMSLQLPTREGQCVRATRCDSYPAPRRLRCRFLISKVRRRMLAPSLGRSPPSHPLHLNPSIVPLLAHAACAVGTWSL